MTQPYAVPAGTVRAGYIGGMMARSALCALPVELLSDAPPAAETLALFVRRLLTCALVGMTAEPGVIWPGCAPGTAPIPPRPSGWS